MKTVVCMKQIHMPYARTGKDPEEFFLSPDDSIYRINPYDEVALEMALNLKETQGEGEVFIITLGPIIAEKELRRCQAMGADDLFQIDVEGELDPWDKSALLAKAIKDLEPDIVLCGKESIDSGNGQVGAFIAHRLGIPYLSTVTDLVIKENNSIEARRFAGRGVREVMECLYPTVISVESGVHDPRLPTYDAKKKAHTTEIKSLIYSEELIEHKTIAMDSFVPRPRPKKVPTPNSSLEAFDRIRQLLRGSKIEKKGEILRGSPESQVRGVISFLDEHGFLKFKKDHKQG